MPLQEVENADDLRLSQRLFKKCMGDKKKFCADIKFGAPHTALAPLSCLSESHAPAGSECNAQSIFLAWRKTVPRGIL